jgi:hypothetical protein
MSDLHESGREPCGRVWLPWTSVAWSGAAREWDYWSEHCCARDLGHDGPHECQCGQMRATDGADDDRVHGEGV